ncbi:MAG: 30S ribosomal protein S17 [Candidatus Micrarchaeota archaeon]
MYAPQKPRDGCGDVRCPRHGSLKTRGRIFEGKVVSVKAKRTAVVELQFLRKVSKYERFEKRKSKLHVHIPDCYSPKDGDIVRFMECRKLSKTKTFVIID